MKNLAVIFIILEFIMSFDKNWVNGFVLHRKQGFVLPILAHYLNDYPGYDYADGYDADVTDCKGNDCFNPSDNEVKSLPDVDCSTGYAKNDMSNELPILGQFSKNDIHKYSEKEISTTTEKGISFRVSELSDLLDKISSILNLERNLEIGSSLDDRGENVNNSDYVDLRDAEEPPVLVLGFENSDSSLNSNELLKAFGIRDDGHISHILVGESVPDNSMEWTDDSDESHKVVENGYIYYDMESRE